MQSNQVDAPQRVGKEARIPVDVQVVPLPAAVHAAIDDLDACVYVWPTHINIRSHHIHRRIPSPANEHS